MALCTAAQARLHIPSLTSTGEDTNLDALITRADALFANWCGYPSVVAVSPTFGVVASMEDTTYVVYNGLGGRVRVLDSRHLRCDIWPVISVTSVYDDTTEAYGTAVTSTTYTLIDGNQGLIAYNANSGAAWANPESPLVRNIKLTVVAGWVTIPADLIEATCLQVKHWWDLRHTQGRTNVSVGAGSAGLRDETMPAAVRELLAPYRLPGVWL